MLAPVQIAALREPSRCTAPDRSAAFATLAETTRDHFRWLSGREHLKGFTADNGTTRTFCDTCGSSITFHTPRSSDDLVEIALGLFDDQVPVQPDAHIFVGSGAGWYTISDDLPQYEAGRDSPRRK